jgi:glucose/arabinose dehydrogenase
MVASRQLSFFIALTIALGLILPSDAAAAVTVPTGFVDQPFASIPGLPIAFDWLPDGDLLVTEQTGKLFRVSSDGEDVTDLQLPIDVCSENERGLLGVAVDPHFGSTSNIFLYYTHDTGIGCANRVSRFTLGSDDSVGSEKVFIDNIPSPASNHNGGDLQFDKNGLLYISVGDGGADLVNGRTQDGNGNARRLDLLNGKILRIDSDGGIPSGNPFRGKGTVRCNETGMAAASVAAAGKHRGRHRHGGKKRHGHKGKPDGNRGPICQEIFATGLRNPFRFAFDPNDATGAQRFYINDVGEVTWEEVDQGKAGADYGWNVREGPCPTGKTTGCSPDRRFTDPIFAYSRQDDPPFNDCRTITGGAFVPDGAGWGAFEGDYLFADFGCTRLFALRGSGANASASQFGAGTAAVHLAFGPDGDLYYTTFDGGGQVRKISPS